MYKKVKRVLVLGVLALFAALVYAEGEQETGVAPKESHVTVREEKSKSSASKENSGYDEIEQATRRGHEKHSRHGKKRKHSQFEENGENAGNQTDLKNPKGKDDSKNKTAKKDNKATPKKKLVQAVEHEHEGISHYYGEVIKFIATTDGKVLKDKMSRQKHPIASLTKVMNILVALDQVDRGNARLDDKVCFTPEIVNMGGSWLNAKAGDCYTLKDLLRAEIIYSANNAAYLVAHHISKGNMDNFVKLMNDKARELGMNDTHYYTPAGLPTSMTHKNMDISTAYDMYLLGRRAIRDERLRAWMKESELVLQNSEGEDVVYNNRNHLLDKFGIYGLKTGFHAEAGYNMIVSSKIGNLEIISVTLGNKSDDARTEDQKQEFTKLEERMIPVYKEGQEIGNTFKVRNAEKKEIKGVLSSNVYQLDNTNYKFKIKDLQVTAEKEGIAKGDVIGKLEVLSNDDKVVGTVDIVAQNDYKQLSLFGRILRFITFGLV
ncbi:D-alanyl-D-alanine carboxypeptidase family protein [Leptotrichia trevisanii]|uniref:D-alanyl-D-alanine carboxypeptidase family protein n=1 Tax=Leptotrichia trevisanii TaxID=109328 RepID=UPI0026E940E8|nr:D-alanyl-D-alanine carboxypeptidase family protein [Leptotrichia trevisanii]